MRGKSAIINEWAYNKTKLMIGIPYITKLFSNIIAQDQVVQGRFYLCPKWGSELNTENILESNTLSLPKDNKYPLALLMLPEVDGNFQWSGLSVQGAQIGYNVYQFWIVFLRPANTTSYGQVSQPFNTTISTHTIPESWHDMQRCAESFMQVLQAVIENKVGYNTIQIAQSNKQKIRYISDLGKDKTCGCLLMFNLLVNGGCDIEGYPTNFLDLIQIPPLVDTHPQHINS